MTDKLDSASGMVPDAAMMRADRLAALVKSVAEQQDRAAFAELFSYLAPRLQSYLKRLGTDGETAEELVQEVMLLVWRKAAQFDPNRAAVATWVFTIARNKRIDYLRRQHGLEVNADGALLEMAEDPEADRLASLALDGDRLRKAISTLPEEQAQVVKESFLNDKTHRMIADELNIPLGTVKSRLRLAFRRLRAALGEPDMGDDA